MQTRPPGQLLYLPITPLPRPIDPSVFREADRLEFQTTDLAKAAVTLRSLASSEDPVIRAEALLRLARVQGKNGQIPAALATYARLGDERLISAAEAPYGLLSRFARCQLLASLGQAAGREEAAALMAQLGSGRWPIGRETYAWYTVETSKLAGTGGEQTSQNTRLAVSEAVGALWDEWRLFQRSGSRSLTKRWHGLEGVPVLAILNANPDRLVAILYAGDSIRQFILDPESTRKNPALEVALLDERGQPVFASHIDSTAPLATRTLSAAQLPWQLQLGISGNGSPKGFLAQRRTHFILLLTAVVGLVSLACYAMARGVLREAAAVRLQSDFVSAVSHEFRSPLSTLRQLTEMLAHGRILDEFRRRVYFDILQKETLRLHHLVENLLDFGSIAAARRQYRLEFLDFTELVRDSVQTYQRQSDAKGYHIELVTDGVLMVHADGEGLRLVVRNLLENAVKYSPGCHTVWVEAGCEERAAVLRVRDQGIGIPPDEQSRIFEKFVRGDAAKQCCIPGTGIGLSMVKEIIRVHQGRVELTSEVGRGSTFTIRLPIRGTNGSTA